MGTSCYAPLETSELLPILKNQKHKKEKPLILFQNPCLQKKIVNNYFEALARLRNQPQLRPSYFK